MIVGLRLAQEQVRAFHEKYGFSIGLLHQFAEQKRKEEPALLDIAKERWQRCGVSRMHHIMEEAAELAQAWCLGDTLKIADGLADLLYVVLGSAVAAGIDLAPVYEAVCRSNMSKDVAGNAVDGLHPVKGKAFVSADADIMDCLKAQGLW